jgi:hypothetical protein
VSLTFEYGFVVADVRRQTGTRRRSLQQAGPVTGDVEDHADDRGAADGAILDEPLADDVDLVDEPVVVGGDDPLVQVDPDDLANLDDQVNDHLDDSLKHVDHVLANPRSYEFWEDTTICVILMCLSSSISGLVRSPPPSVARLSDQPPPPPTPGLVTSVCSHDWTNHDA